MLTACFVLLVLQSATPDAIDRAVTEGQRTRKAGGIYSQAFGSPYDVTIQGPLGRVQGFAAEATLKLQPIGEIPPALLDSTITVRVTPRAPVSGLVTSRATHIALRLKDGTVVQPASLELFPVEWSNALGGRAQSGGLTAMFPVPVGDGDLQFVVVNAAGQHKTHTIKAKDRAKLR